MIFTTLHPVCSVDGNIIAAHDTGPVETRRVPLLCLPGLTRTARDFETLAGQAEALGRRVVAIDFRGRGASDRTAPESYTPAREADDVLAVQTALGLGPCILVGTSRGGIVAMVIAVQRPGAIAGSVLNDIGPAIDMRGLLRLRSSIGTRRPPEDFADAVRLVKAGLAHQFPAFDEDDWLAYAKATFAFENGKPVSDCDPAVLSGLSALSSKIPAIPLYGPFKALAKRPMLVLRGEHSDILSQESLAFAETVGAATYTVEGQGHAPVLGGAVLDRMAAFLSPLN